MKTNTKLSRWPWFGLGALAGLAGGWLLTRRQQTEAAMPHLAVWQRELAKTRGTADAALLAGRIQARYDELRARGPRFSHPALRQHLLTGILPGLALYQTLQAETTPEAALAEVEMLFAVAYTGQSALFPLIKRLPASFAIFRAACKLILQRSFPSAGWGMTFVEDTPDCIAFDMRDRCLYRDVLTVFGAPELTAVFCRMDDLVYGRLAPQIIFTRTKTLGQGDECCNFRYCRGQRREWRKRPKPMFSSSTTSPRHSCCRWPTGTPKAAVPMG